MDNKLVISSSPHIRAPENIRSIMIDVLIALVPAAFVSVLLFGYRALIVMVVGMFSAMIVEAIYLRKLDIFSDGSAAVTGLLLALILPANSPWWMVTVGAAVAIIVGKQLFGGLGYNIFNPALVGRAVLLVSWAAHMVGNIWPVPKVFDLGADLVTSATPLASEAEALKVTFTELFLGNVAGSLGETSALALLLGAAWLLYRGHIDWRIPGGYLVTVFVMGAVLGGGFYHSTMGTGLFHVLAGGVLLGALFMATDMVTTPVTGTGRLIFGIGCGVITMMIRLYGNFPEGVTFAILLMNAVTPIIDNFTAPKKFGEVGKQ